MLTLRRSEQLRAACRKFLATQNQPAVMMNDDEYTEQPEYPPTKDLSYRARKQREALHWQDQIRHVPTVEEKMIKMNMPRYYGYKVVNLSDDKLPYNCLPSTQHYTRTVFEEMTAPKTSSAEHDALVAAVKSEVLEGLEYAHDYFSHKHAGASKVEPQQQERLLAQIIIEQVNRALINTLAADCAHLQDVEVDYNPRHEAFWFVGGIDPPKNVVKSKEGRDWQKDMAKDPVDRMMQYVATPYLALRHRQQLEPWKSEAEVENAALAKELPRYKYDPRTLGYTTGHRHGTNIPGFWPGSPNGFGCISYQSRAHMQIRPTSYGADDFKEVLHAQAIQSSFAWLLAQANYNGFNTFADLTYPMNTQNIITNGRDWSFYEYQLNTVLVHSHHVDENLRVNFCRGTAEQQLYQEIDANNKCVGFNEEVLRHLVQFYVNAPTVQRSAGELQPYLDGKVKRIADYSDDDKREFLERTFKYMTSDRPRHLPLPEIYLWEKIYKIDNKTRPMEAKRRFFELGINPWKRSMDQHQKEYIPRVVRPEGPKSKKKWKQMYYP